MVVPSRSAPCCAARLLSLLVGQASRPLEVAMRQLGGPLALLLSRPLGPRHLLTSSLPLNPLVVQPLALVLLEPGSLVLLPRCGRCRHCRRSIRIALHQHVP